MFAKIYHSLAIISIAVLFAAGGLAGYLFTIGGMDGDKLTTIADVLRGQHEESPELADEPAEEELQTAQAASAEELREQRRDEELRRALWDRAARDAQAQRELVEHALQDTIEAQERLDAERAAWRAERERLRGEAEDEGFRKEVQYVSKLPAKQAKVHLIAKWRDQPADAVHLLNGLPVSVGKRIFEQMKTPEEQKIMHELLERLSQLDVENIPSGSGRTAGD